MVSAVGINKLIHRMESNRRQCIGISIGILYQASDPPVTRWRTNTGIDYM
jgi:hypothetical protein